jgi:hypothetical protein
VIYKTLRIFLQKKIRRNIAPVPDMQGIPAGDHPKKPLFMKYCSLHFLEAILKKSQPWPNVRTNVRPWYGTL